MWNKLNANGANFGSECSIHFRNILYITKKNCLKTCKNL